MTHHITDEQIAKAPASLADIQRKLVSAQSCHPKAVQTLIAEALDLIDDVARAGIGAAPAPAVPSEWRSLVSAVVDEEAGHIEHYHGSWNSERTRCTACGATDCDGYVGGESLDHWPGCKWIAKQSAIKVLRAMLTAAPTPPAQTTPEPVGGPWGWAIEDKHGVAQAIRPARKEFFGCVQSTEPFTAEDIAKMDREWVGIAPHRIVTLHTRPAEQPSTQPVRLSDVQRVLAEVGLDLTLTARAPGTTQPAQSEPVQLGELAKRNVYDAIGVTVRERGKAGEPTRVLFMCTEWLKDHSGDIRKATRRAIVRAAASIGEAQK